MKVGQRTRSSSWRLMLFLLLFGATFLNYSQRFVFTQNTTKIQMAFGVGSGESQLGIDSDPESSRNVEAYSAAASRFSYGFAIGSLVFGILADIVSVRWLYPIVVIVWSVAGMVTGMVETTIGLALSRFVLGLFEAGHWPCSLRTTQRSFPPENRVWGNSVLQSGASLGAVLTPILVLVVHRYDPTLWRYSFFIVGMLGIPWAIAWCLCVREEDVTRPVIQTDETSDGLGRKDEIVEVPFFRIFAMRRWWLLLVTVLCINTVWHFIRVWMTDWLENVHHYSHEFTGTFTAIYFSMTFVGALSSGGLIALLARRGWNVHRARMTTFLLFAVLTALVVPAAFASKGWLLLGLLLIVAFGSLGLFPVYYSLNQEISGKHQGKVGGSLGFATWLTLGWFHDWVGAAVKADPQMRTTIFCLVGLAPLLAYLILRFGWGTRAETETP